MTEFIFPVRVYYEDTDVAGIVYHANYLRFFERGRTEWLRELGVDQTVLIDQGLAFAVTKINIDYIKPARFNDLLEVVTVIDSSKRASLIFKQVIRDKNRQDHIYSKAEVKAACIDMKTLKPKALPKQLLKEIICER
ncbi:MAG: tol-pal system-associated acyl-CoA thioesterase [Gammaproteobacteria bacterium]|nr:MAG: tol-pal system-associated acyl-CoA thioesterase [Gammaproteobacteria bacterium]